MKRTIGAAAFVVAVAIFQITGAHSACATEKFEPFSPERTTFRLASETTYTHSDDVRLTFTATNRSSSDERFNFLAPPLSFKLEVLDGKGDLVSPTVARDVGGPYSFGGSPTYVPVLKGGTTYSFMSSDGSTNEFSLRAWGYVLDAGVYTLRATWMNYREAVTNSIKLTVSQDES